MTFWSECGADKSLYCMDSVCQIWWNNKYKDLEPVYLTTYTLQESYSPKGLSQVLGLIFVSKDSLLS